MRRRLLPLFSWALGTLTAASACATHTAQTPAQAPPVPTQSPAAMTQAPLREKVEALLGGERAPSAEEWKKLGPEALWVLEQIYNDPAALPSRRTRAVASMALVDDPAAIAHLEAILFEPATEESYRAIAAQALAQRVGPAALEKLSPLLSSKTATTREAAVRAIGTLSTPEAKKKLEEHLEIEDDSAVREVAQQTLTKMQP